ncbi:MAG TPA: hypothetical protein VFZ78_04365 [Flavisolibacter sp.]
MKQLLAITGIALMLASCTHVYYAPNTVNAPLLAEKRETRFNVLLASGGDSEFTGGELQLATAVTDNIGIMVNGLAAGEKEDVTHYNINGSTTTREESGKGSYIEAAGGYFTRFGTGGSWVMEAYVGIGAGTVRNEYGGRNFSKVNSTKLFLQPSIGYKSKHFEAAIVPRLGHVSWKTKERYISSGGDVTLETELYDIERNPSFMVFEPGFVIRAGGPLAKIQVSLSTSTPLGSDRDYTGALMESANASIGLSVMFPPKKK